MNPVFDIAMNVLIVVTILSIIVCGMHLISKFFIWFTNYNRVVRRRNKRRYRHYKNRNNKKRRG